MDAILDLVRRRWGYGSLRALQREAMEAALAGRDALVVLPTGGGKSLCYQAPALLAPGLTVVVSPLIALMKDQVDRLRRRGIPSAFLNSSLEIADRRKVASGAARGDVRLLYVAPERFADPTFLSVLAEARVRAFAVDEAHCISHWGHDFREAYGRLSLLRKAFPVAPVHALTATATRRVREDVVRLLDLRDPLVLVGDFFRPNLHLRVGPRRDPLADVLGVIARRPRQAGIVYVIRRADVDDLAHGLRDAGVSAVAYHAGLEEPERSRAQDEWMAGAAQVVVATVAFGMGIDRRDVRFVVHAAMPQSPEHYQQEAGRAGRDGQPAECVLFWSTADADLWRSLIRSQGSPEAPEKERLVGEMERFCASSSCRHRALVEYFGQEWKGSECHACDVCDEASRVAMPRARHARAEAVDRGVFNVLRSVRRGIADRRGIPASAIASDSALREIAAVRPTTLAELRRTPGMGRAGFRAWGGQFLSALREFGF
jgi:ATP-dependent DNA helicase RecQ